MNKVRCFLQGIRVCGLGRGFNLHLQCMNIRSCCSKASSKVASTFLVFKFIRISSFMCCVMGLYKVSQLFFRGVVRCCGTGI
jgi:hypothetical protein